MLDSLVRYFPRSSGQGIHYYPHCDWQKDSALTADMSSVATNPLNKISGASRFLSMRRLKTTLCIFLLLVSLPLLLTLPASPFGTIRVTQHELTTEGLGAALMHLRKPIILAQLLNGCLDIPKIKSEHGYFVRQFFDPCPAPPIFARRICKVALSISEGNLLVSMPERGPVNPRVLRTCQSIHVVNPQLRDYDNAYNSTEYIFNNLKQVTNVSLDCDGIDTVFHYRYGDIANDTIRRGSKQVHEDLVLDLVAKREINDSRLLIVTEPSGQKHIESKFPNSRFFTENDPAALRECAGKAVYYIGGGSTYAYVCYQLLKPKVVYTNNLKAPSRVKFPVHITRVLSP